MSTEKVRDTRKVNPVAEPLNMRDLASVLVKHYGLRAGRYDLIIEFKVGVGPVGPSPNDVIPGAMIGISKIGLAPTDKRGGATVDAAEVNPEKGRARAKVV